MAVLGDLGTAGHTRLESFILGNVNTVMAGLVMWRRRMFAVVIGNGSVTVWYFFKKWLSMGFFFSINR